MTKAKFEKIVKKLEKLCEKEHFEIGFVLFESKKDGMCRIYGRTKDLKRTVQDTKDILKGRKDL